MNTYEIKLEIKEKISKTDETFINIMGTEIYTGISGDDIGLLEKLLKKVNRYFMVYKIAAILFSTLLIVVSILKFFESIDHFNMNKSGLVILFTLVFLLTAFRYHKVKVNLESKIWLLKFLERIEKV